MLRPAQDDDRDLVLPWRNHPQVRRMSFDTHEINADEHARWWEQVRQDPHRRLYVYERDGVPSGVVAFDLDGEGAASWSFYLDVDGLDDRGELLTAWLDVERQVLRTAFDELGLERLRGEMLADNSAVRQLHRRHGFTETVVETRMVEGEPREVVTIELTAADRAARVRGAR